MVRGGEKDFAGGHSFPALLVRKYYRISVPLRETRISSAASRTLKAQMKLTTPAIVRHECIEAYSH